MPSPAALSEAMLRACHEARRWLGATSPNPPVGAVALDESGNILAVAAHECAGGKHAERTLIDYCRVHGLTGRIHTVVVTLEPCNHHGRTPPCCDLLIETGIRNVVIGTRDPNANVCGGGVERLREAGINVTLGVEEEKTKQLIYAFAYSVKTGRPWVTVKRALDEKGSMIPPPGQKTFASDESLRLAHRLRKRADAIMTGSGTILADDPLFTVRRVPDYPEKTRILAILDRRRRVPDAWLREAASRGFIPVLYSAIDEALADLTIRNAREVLIEAGPSLSQSVLEGDSWVQAITVHKGNPDRIDIRFRPNADLPFDPAQWDLESMLPVEER